MRPCRKESDGPCQVPAALFRTEAFGHSTLRAYFAEDWRSSSVAIWEALGKSLSPTETTVPVQSSVPRKITLATEK